MNDPGSLALIEQKAPVEDTEDAVRALLGAVIHGVLDHVGAEDLRSWELESTDEVTIGRIGRILEKGDTGLHGCGFEYAIHAALNDDSRIPHSVRGIVVTTVTTETAVLMEQLGVPVSGWSSHLRAVMVGSERRKRTRVRDWVHLDYAPDHTDFEQRIGEEVGHGALIWGDPAVGPHAVWPLLPDLRCAGAMRNKGGRLTGDPASRGAHHLPADLARLWQADLLIGGADVRRTPAVETALGAIGVPFDVEPTAWIAATLKYPRGKAEPGPGIHLAIDTTHGSSERFTRSERVALTSKDGLRGVRLPLDGDFVRAFNTAYALLRTWAWKGTRSPHPRDVPEFNNRRLYALLSSSRSRKAHELADELLRMDSKMPAVEAAEQLTANVSAELVAVVNAPGTSPDSIAHTTIAPVPQPVAA